MPFTVPGTGNMGVPGADGYDRERNAIGFWPVPSGDFGKGLWQLPLGPRIQNYHLAHVWSTPKFDTVQQTYPKPDNSKDIDPATHVGSAQESGMTVAGPAHYTFVEQDKHGSFQPMVFTKDHWVTGIVPSFNPSINKGGPTAERILGANF